MFFTHDIFSPPDGGGPLGALPDGEVQPWQPQVVPEVTPGGELFAPRPIAEVNPLLQPFAPKPLPIASTVNVLAPHPITAVSTSRVAAPGRTAVPLMPLLTVPKGGTQRPLAFLPGGTAPGTGIPIPVPGQVPPPDGQPAPGESTTPKWVMPVALGAAALLIGYLLFGRKKTATPNTRGWSRTEHEAKGRRKKAKRRHKHRRARALGALHNPKRRKKGKPRIVAGHPATRRCPHCGGAHSRSAHWSHLRGHHRGGPKGGSFYGHVR